jgi:TM2 domain-containing membrane protein YozV
MKGIPMNRAVNAALLSAFVFPGAGHLLLRRPLRACIFALPALAAAIVFFGDVATRVSGVIDKVLAGQVAPDPLAIAAQLDAHGGGSALANLCGAVLLACWIGSIVDSFIVGRSATRQAE